VGHGTVRLSSKVMQQHEFLFIAIDYFAKWVEGEAIASIIEREVQNFI